VCIGGRERHRHLATQSQGSSERDEGGARTTSSAPRPHFDQIKPPEHNRLTVPIERTVLEPYAGRAIYDVGVDGSTCTWVRVLLHEPPHRLVISWDISPRWQAETDPSRAGETIT
jgi:hypothetical protein